MEMLSHFLSLLKYMANPIRKVCYTALGFRIKKCLKSFLNTLLFKVFNKQFLIPFKKPFMSYNVVSCK